jgi:hypothetical protein
VDYLDALQARTRRQKHFNIRLKAKESNKDEISEAA